MSQRALEGEMKGIYMIHKGEQLEREIERLERQASNELNAKKRRDLRSLASDKRDQKRKWFAPR